MSEELNDQQWKDVRKIARESSFTIPKEFKWSVDDFKDLYFTMRRFKKRFIKRRGNAHG
jgi:hypothetical protein